MQRKKQETIFVQVNKQKEEEIEKKSEIFKIDNIDNPIMWTTGLSLRGHRDDGRIDPQIDREQNDGSTLKI